MSLKTKVKVGNITNLSDARYCAGMGVDLLGFKIGNEAGQVSPVKFKEITEWISGPEFILESTEPPVEWVSESQSIKLIELPFSAISTLSAANSENQFIIRIELNDWIHGREELIKYVDKITYLLIRESSNVKELLRKELVTEMASYFKVFLGFEMHVQQLDEYLTWPIEGLALNGSEETSPGIKDYDHLSSILEKLEVD